jgi:hypothetical protein
LDVRTAFDPKFDPATLDVEPGQTVTVKVPANRVPTFNGAVTLTDSNPHSAFVYPPVIEIPTGKVDVEFKLQVQPDTATGRYQLRFESVGYVGKYQERLRNPILTINVKQPKKQAKKK